MYLKRLSLSGFKTFATLTELEFHPGITAIVGPNGTGKSNIADAIVWSLGERSMKALRGSKPLDVIFAGNEARKGVGMAEVSLTLDNSDARLPVAFSEVTITRRIYRDGNTEYFINKTPCRLRDIQELFYDTGVGADAYSVVNQSGIDAVLSIRPEDRRELFVEAAGVKKYRSKRDEAKRKLERTEQNLVRVRDIVHELETQLAPLAEQVEAALAYENYVRRLQELQLALLAWEYDVRVKRTANLQEQRSSLAQQIATTHARILELEQQERDLEESQRRREKQIAVLQQDLTQVVSDVRSTEGSIALAQERIRSFMDQRELLDQDLRVLLARCTHTRRERENLLTTVSALEAACRETDTQVSEYESRLAELNRGIVESTEQLNHHKSDYIELMRAASKKRNGIAASEATQASLAWRLTHLESVARTTQEERENTEKARNEISAGLEKIKQQIASLESRVDSARGEQLECESEHERLRAILQHTREEMGRVQSRLNTLEEMEQRFEGLSQGVRNTLQAAKENRLPGTYRLVADILRVPDEYRKAIEVALGAALESIVTEDATSARNAIAYLTETHGGRATFFPMDLLRPHAPLAPAGLPLDRPGVRGIASHLVQFEEYYRPVVEHLLGHILIVEALYDALALASSGAAELTYATLAGELVIPGGAVTGGQGEQGGLLARKHEITALREHSVRLERECLEHEDSLKVVQTRIERTQQNTRGLEREHNEAQTAYVRQERELEHIQREVRRLDAVLEQIHLDQATLRVEADQSNATRDQLQKELEALENKIHTLDRHTERLQSLLAAQVSQRDEVASSLSEARVRQAATEERLTSMRRQIQECERSNAEAETSIREKEQSIASGTEECENLAVEIAANEMKLEALRARQQEMEQSFEDWRRTRMETLDALEQTSRQLHDQRNALHESEMRLHQVELRATQTETEMSEMERRFREEHETTAEASLTAKESIENKQHALEEVDALRQKIESLGEVNLGAIAEQKRLTERLEFLTTQRNDLETAKDELQQIIAEIDQRTKDQFLATFEAVQREFQNMFQRIFDGGRTELLLTDPDNILETGIDIAVQLPGKTQQDLLLLSGGERALTALALLLGLLRVKPSPFCILDEVDAPLDEARVERFTQLLREFALNSQFIIITHNRGTMEASDQLYGVTMEEQGVSQLVSVKLRENGV